MFDIATCRYPTTDTILDLDKLIQSEYKSTIYVCTNPCLYTYQQLSTTEDPNQSLEIPFQ